MLIGRLILLSKSNSPITTIDKTRPIAIQSIPVRILEKVVKDGLEEWQIWNNWKIGKYQAGFQRGFGTFFNILRVKRYIKVCKSMNKAKRPIIFALDIAGAFDKVPRKYYCLQSKKRSSDVWRENAIDEQQNGHTAHNFSKIGK